MFFRVAWHHYTCFKLARLEVADAGCEGCLYQNGSVLSGKILKRNLSYIEA